MCDTRSRCVQDGFLECLVPVDYQRGDWGSNFVTDEEINAIVGSLPAGATLIMQIDAGIKVCHSVIACIYVNAIFACG